MLAFIAQRTLIMIPTMILISVIVFIVIQLPPGDYLDTLVSQMASQGDRVDDAQLVALRARYGLDQPLVIQYFHWIGGIITRGDFGQSFEWNKPITELIVPRLALTPRNRLGGADPHRHHSRSPSVSTRRSGSIPSATTSRHSFGFIGLAIPNVLLTLALLYLTFITFGLEPGGLFSRE